MSSSRTLSLLGGCLAVLVLVGAGAEAVSLWRVEQAHPTPPRWDMAGHGWQGVELLTDLEAGRPLDFLVHLNAQDKWPFGYSLLLLPALAVGGATFASARLLSLVGWVAVAPLTVLAARRIDPGPAGLLGGALAAVLWLAAPVERVLALVILRETVSLALLLVALILYLRAREREGPTEPEQPAGPGGGALGAWRAAGLATLALVLVKYTYALIWIVTVGLDELRRLPGDRRRRLLRWLYDLLTPWGDKPPRRRLLAGALDLLLLAALLGVNPGIAIWLGLGVTAVVLGVAARRGRFSLGARLAALPARYRAAVETVALPVAVWWLSPHPIHPKTVYAFFRNSGGGSERAPWDVVFYLRSYLADYVPHPGWGVALLGLAVLAGVLALRREGPLRVLALLALVGLVLVSIHPHKEVRYAATALPLVTLLGALGLGRLIFGRGPRTGVGGRGRLIAGSLLGLGIVGAAVLTGLLGETGERLDHRLAGEYALYTGDPRVAPWLEPLAERVGPKGRLGVVGVVDELSADLVRWALAREHGADAPRVDELRKRFDPGAPREEWWPRVERWLETEALDRVLVLRLDPDSPWARRDDYRLHNAWQAAAAEALAETYPPRGEPVRAPEIGLEAEVLEIDRSPRHEQGETK
jgi:hypothetical protein